MDGVMWALAKKKTPWKEDLYFAMKLARQKLSKNYVVVTPTAGMLVSSANIFDHFHWSRWVVMCDTWMDITLEDNTSYTTKYQEVFPQYLGNEFCAKHRCVPLVTPEWVRYNNLFLIAIASSSGQSSFEPCHLSSVDEEYWTGENVAGTTPGRSDRSALLLTTARLHLNLTPQSPKNWGQVNLNLNDYESNSMVMSTTLLVRVITDWLHQQDEPQSNYTKSLQCGAQSILYQTTSCRSGRQFISWLRYYWLVVVEYLRRDHCEKDIIWQFA